MNWGRNELWPLQGVVFLCDACSLQQPYAHYYTATFLTIHDNMLYNSFAHIVTLDKRTETN